jgi:hypothetical protein
MAVSTIEGHLAWFVGVGQLNIDKLVAVEKINLISILMKNFDPTGMGPVKAALGDKVTWSELRFVMKSIENSKKSHS